MPQTWVLESGREIDLIMLRDDLESIFRCFRQRSPEVLLQWCPSYEGNSYDVLSYLANWLYPERLSWRKNVTHEWQKATAVIMRTSALNQIFDIPEDLSVMQYYKDVPPELIERIGGYLWWIVVE